MVPKDLEQTPKRLRLTVMRFAREAGDWSAQIIVLIFATAAVAQPFVIPSGSMEGTLMTGDHVIVDKLIYSPHRGIEAKLLPYREPERGDIIVFRYPPDLNKTLVKRVIGLPGDHLHLEHGTVVRNGIPLHEPYTQHIAQTPDQYRDNFPSGLPQGLSPQAEVMLRFNVSDGDVIVPVGQYFAMGDNRDNSSDSRYWGFVPRENIIGTPLIVFWSYDAPTEDLMDYKFSHLVDLSLHFFTKTRWDRTFHLIRKQQQSF